MVRRSPAARPSPSRPTPPASTSPWRGHHDALDVALRPATTYTRPINLPAQVTGTSDGLPGVWRNQLARGEILHELRGGARGTLGALPRVQPGEPAHGSLLHAVRP